MGPYITANSLYHIKVKSNLNVPYDNQNSDTLSSKSNVNVDPVDDVPLVLISGPDGQSLEATFNTVINVYDPVDKRIPVSQWF